MSLKNILLFFCFLSFVQTDISAQMIKVLKKKDEATKTVKKNNKPIAQLKDDDEPEPAHTPSVFGYLTIRSNKGAPITVTVNDTVIGKIKAASFKKIPVDSGMTMNISLNDGQGNTKDTLINIEETERGKNIELAFPEIDYEAIKAEIARLKKEELQKIRDLLVIEMNNMEAGIKSLSGILAETKNQIAADTMSIRTGEKEFTSETRFRMERYIQASKTMQDSLQSYNAKAAINDYKTQSAEFIKTLTDRPDEKTRKGFENFLALEKNRTRSLSANVAVAFKASRLEDFKFYFDSATINEPVVNGKKPLMYAIEQKASEQVFKYLFSHGADPNNFRTRFSDNEQVYATPFALASIQHGDPKVVKLFFDAGAKYHPDLIPKRQQRLNNRYVIEHIKPNKVLMEYMQANKMLPDDGSAAMSITLDELDSSMVKMQGDFSIGCISLYAVCGSDEKPNADISLSPYKISKYELTQKQWMSVMDYENPSDKKNCDNCPVENISWDDIVVFIERLNEFSVPLGKKYRLPTEAEWEFAAKGGGKVAEVTTFSGSNTANDVAWFNDNSSGTVHPVGQKAPNAAGMYDMSGNVAEWCNDWYLENYFVSIEKKDPQGPAKSLKKVIHGGAWSLSDFSARSSNREGYEPFFKNANIGFRLVMEEVK